jgi:transcription initiation factor TFIIIB Brf1 subunit/transcription initiation factor TFIIB
MDTYSENDINKLDINSEEIWDLLDSLEISDSNEKTKFIDKCYNCDSTKIYTDQDDSVIRCDNCGLKLLEMLDSNPDWNSINSTCDNISRCGAPTNYYFPQSSLGTKVTNGRFTRISVLERWSQMPYKERSRYEVLKYIDTKCKASDISQPIIDNAKNIFNELSLKKHQIETDAGDTVDKNIIIRGFNRKGIISACVLNGSNLQGKPMTPKEVGKIFGITEKQVTKGNRKLRDILNDDTIISNIRSSQSDEYIDRKEYINMLKFDKVQIELAKKIAKNVKRLDIATDHQPASLAAGSVMLMANILNLSLSKKIISDTFDISQVTIIKTFRKIFPYRKLLISNEATEKVLKLANKSLITSDDSEEYSLSIKTKEYNDSDDDGDEINDVVEIKNKSNNLISKYV